MTTWAKFEFFFHSASLLRLTHLRYTMHIYSYIRVTYRAGGVMKGIIRHFESFEADDLIVLYIRCKHITSDYVSVKYTCREALHCF